MLRCFFLVQSGPAQVTTRMTRQGWRTAELRAPQLARHVDRGEPHPVLQEEDRRDCIRAFVRSSGYNPTTRLGHRPLLSSAATTVWRSSPAAAHSVVYHHYKYAKEDAVQRWDACVSSRTPHHAASRKTPVPPALASMASRGGKTACGEFPGSLVLVSNLLVKHADFWSAEIIKIADSA